MLVLAIPRAQRLRHRAELAAVRRAGRSYRSELVNLRALGSPEPASRFAFTANLSVGPAVTRNKVKRRLREIARALPVLGGWHLMLIARPGAASARFGELRASVQELMRRAGVLDEDKR